MNIFEIRGLLNRLNISLLEVKGKLSPTSGYYHYSNLRELKEVINQLGLIPTLSPISQKLIESELYAARGNGSGDSIAIDGKYSEYIDERLKSLYNNALYIKDFLDETLPKEKDDSIRIKLPPVKDFDDIAKVMNDLKKAISIPMAEEGIDGQVVVEHGEAGSIWLFVYLGARKAVKLVAEIGWAAMVILNKKNELNYVAEEVKAYKMGQEYMAALVDTQKKLLAQLVEGEATGIHNRINEDGKPLDPEAHQKLILSINTMANLYERGFKMLPSLSVKEDVANLFPSSTVEKLIESRNKQLPEGGNSEGKE